MLGRSRVVSGGSPRSRHSTGQLRLADGRVGRKQPSGPPPDLLVARALFIRGAAYTLIGLLAFLNLVLLLRSVEAAWPSDPAVNVPVCTTVGYQTGLTAVADGLGGVFIAWQDQRGGIYAQHVRA